MSGRAWEPAVLEIIARSGQVKLAAECAGITREWVHIAARRDPRLAEKIRKAKAAYVENVTRGALVKFNRAG